MTADAAGGADALGPDRRGRGTHAEFGVALLLELLGSAGAVIVALQTWQVVTTLRPGRPTDVLRLTGRVVDAAPLAFALVALAGVVAVLATRGVVRRAVGVIVVLAGAGLVWRAVQSAGAVTADRARTLVAEAHRSIPLDTATAPSVATHPVFPVLTVVFGVLVMAGGGLVAWRGHRWRAMSARYEAQAAAPSDPTTPADPSKAATSMWTALDRGEDPTAGGRGTKSE